MGKKSRKSHKPVAAAARRGRGAMIVGSVAVLLLGVAGFCAVALRHGTTPSAVAAPTPPTPGSKSGMLLIPGGEFVMGTDDPKSMANERPAHKVKVDSFWMDEHDVTNAEFTQFVKATGYVTTAGEGKGDREGKGDIPIYCKYSSHNKPGDREERVAMLLGPK